MTAHEIKRLADNIRRDGCLTSAILVCPKGKDRYEILSGHHRKQAAEMASIDEAPCLVVMDDLTEEQKTAIQLSHNAMTGQDDQSILRHMYETLDLMEKRYTGLTDADLELLPDLKVDSLAIGQPSFQEIRMSFLPEDKDELDRYLKRVEDSKGNLADYCASLEGFEALMGACEAVREKYKVHNVGATIIMLCQLAEERLEQVDGEQQLGEATGDEGAAADGTEGEV